MKTESIILNAIKQHPLCSITQLAKHCKLNRMTVGKYLFAMELLDTVESKKIGMSKIYKVK